MDTSDSMDSTETQSGWSVAPASEEIVVIRLLEGESDNVISETSGRVAKNSTEISRYM